MIGTQLLQLLRLSVGDRRSLSFLKKISVMLSFLQSPTGYSESRVVQKTGNSLRESPSSQGCGRQRKKEKMGISSDGALTHFECGALICLSVFFYVSC